MNGVFLDGFFKQSNLLRKGLDAAGDLTRKAMTNPHSKKILIGAGAGAGAGAIGNATLNNSNESVGSKALKGALGGAVLGAGAGYGYSKYKNRNIKQLHGPTQVVHGDAKKLTPEDHLAMSNPKNVVRLDRGPDGVYKAAFLLGFNKQAGIPGVIGSFGAKLYKAPGQAVQAVKNLPETVRKGIDTVKATMARNKQEMLTSHAREMGFKNRAARSPLDLSSKASKGRIMTGKASPESIRQSNGSLLSRVRNVATAGTLAAGTGIYMGMKDPEQDQRR